MLDLWKTLTLLQHHYPLNDKVTVQIEHIEDDVQGLWSYDEKEGHVIRISTSVPEDLRDEVLTHEYAHAICSYLPAHLADIAWGLTYGELYKLVYGDH